MSLSDKYTVECLACNLTYVGKSSRKDYSVVKCMTCGTVEEFAQGNIRAGRVSCSNCNEIKWKSECLSNGLKYLGKPKDRRYSTCECQVCGHVDDYVQSAIRDGRVSCTNCNELKWKSECLSNGLKYLGKPKDRHYSTCECQVCGHVDDYDQGAIRAGEVSCSNCKELQWKDECLANGLKYLGKPKDRHYSTCECQVCGHVDDYQQTHIRAGSVSCSKCSPGHWNETCFFYLARISYGNSTIIKIGVAADPLKRYTQYGLLPGADITEILRMRFETKLEAVDFESKMKSLLKHFHIHRDAAKLILTYSGFTECYSSEAEDIVKESFV